MSGFQQVPRNSHNFLIQSNHSHIDALVMEFKGLRDNMRIPLGVDWKTLVAIGVCPQCGHSIMQAKDGRQFCTSCDFDPLKYLEG